MDRSYLLLLSFLFIFLKGQAQSAPKPADEILKEAFQQAAKEKKNVFVIFHASWCGWCHKMDSSMNDAACKDFFNNNYIIRHLTVLESDKNKNWENPGAEDMLVKYHGKDQGIPYWLIFDKNGSLLADSQIRPQGAAYDVKGANTGCPASQEEVAYFIEVLKKTSTLSNTQLAIIEKRFSRNKE